MRRAPKLLTYEDAIQHFLHAIGPTLSPGSTLREVLTELVKFYGATRIKGTSLENDDDMFSIEISCSRKITFPKPGDYRNRGDEAVVFGDLKYLQVEISRTVIATEHTDDDSDFDNDGSEMVVTLYYDAKDDKSMSGFFEASDPAMISEEVNAAISQHPFRELIERIPSGIEYFVGGGG